MQLFVRFRKFARWTLLAALLFVGAKGYGSNVAQPAFQYHCGGAAQLTGDTNLSVLQKVLGLPSAAPAEKLILAKFSRLLAQNWRLGTNAGLLIEPMLRDVIREESLGSFGGSNGASDFFLAVHLNEKRPEIWRTALSKIFGVLGENFSLEDFEGTRWGNGSNAIWMIPARNWIMAGQGNDFSALETNYLRDLKTHGRPAPALQTNWMEAEVNWTGASPWMPAWAHLMKPAHIIANIAAEPGQLHLNARVLYPGNIPWPASVMKTPANVVRGPLISFTAGNDIAAFLNLGPAISNLASSPLTSQYYAWALNQMPLQSYTAWSVPNGSNALNQLATAVPAEFNAKLKKFNGTELHWLAKPQRLVLENLRVVAPSLEVVPDKTGDYLQLSVFPNQTANAPVPDKLWRQIEERTNLVYYDWELTGSRLQTLRLLGPMLLTPRHESTDEEEDASNKLDKWMDGIRFDAGNSVTEITRAAPNELSVVRTSPIGLTGIEMFLLSQWMSGLGASAMNPLPTAR